MTSFRLHNINYQYESTQKGCFYCRQRFAKFTKFKIKFWNDKRVCSSCYIQLSHGIEIKPASQNLKTVILNPENSILPPKLCKLCRKNLIYPISVTTKRTGFIKKLDKYPHFCKDCRITFAQMVSDNPKQP